MSLVTLLKEGEPKAHRFDRVMAAYRSLPPVEQDAFVQLINDPLWSGPQIAAELCKMGHDITGGQIVAFRNKVKTGRVSL